VRKEGKARFLERMGGAISAAEYLFQGLGRGLDLNALDGQARLADLALPYIRTIPDGVLREMTMERLATITKTSPEALKRGAKMSRAPSPGRRAIPEGRGTSRLSERLLTILLKHPEFLAKLDDHRRAASSAWAIPYWAESCVTWPNNPKPIWRRCSAIGPVSRVTRPLWNSPTGRWS
jgi:DNA primase